MPLSSLITWHAVAYVAGFLFAATLLGLLAVHAVRTAWRAVGLLLSWLKVVAVHIQHLHRQAAAVAPSRVRPSAPLGRRP